MKKFVKSIALLLLFALACSALIVVPTVAETYAATYTVGEGGDFETFKAAFDDTETVNWAAGTILFNQISDVTDPVKPTLDGAKNAVINGNGYTTNLAQTFIVQNTTKANAELTKTVAVFRDMKFHYSSAPGTQAAISARTNSDVTVINCETDDSFDRVFALSSGNCHLTIESGYYKAKESVFYFSYTNKIANTCVINGGYFELSEETNSNLSYPKTMIRMGGALTIDVNGGVFAFDIGCPFAQDLAYSEGTGALNLTKASIYYPAGQTLFSMLKSRKGSPAVVTMNDDVKFHEINTIVAGDLNSSYEALTPAVAVTPVAASELKAKIVTASGAEIATSVNAALDTAKTNKLFVLLTDDCTATATFDNVVFDKNGHTAANVTGSKVRDGLDGAQVYVQYHKVSDTEAAARILVAYSAEYTEASVTLQGSKDPVVQNISKYFTSIQAGGEEVTAVELGGYKILAVDIVGLTKAAFSDASHSLTVTLNATDGVNNSSTGAKIFTIQIPDDVLASLS